MYCIQSSHIKRQRQQHKCVPGSKNIVTSEARTKAENDDEQKLEPVTQVMILATRIHHFHV